MHSIQGVTMMLLSLWKAVDVQLKMQAYVAIHRTSKPSLTPMTKIIMDLSRHFGGIISKELHVLMDVEDRMR